MCVLTDALARTPLTSLEGLSDVACPCFGARYDLPIPLLLFVVGGAAVVVLSFLLVIPRAVAARNSDDARLVDLPVVRPMHPGWGPLSILALLGLTLCALTGSNVVAENLAPTAFWLFVWIAVPLSCGLIGDCSCRVPSIGTSGWRSSSPSTSPLWSWLIDTWPGEQATNTPLGAANTRGE